LFASSKKGLNIGKLRMSLPTALVAAVGLSYIAIVVAAVIVIAINAGNYFNAPLQGTVFVYLTYEEFSDVRVSLLSGYWLACAVGPLLLILAGLRRFIVGIEIT
jgi:hypothetical protein